jgi:hypothetical protein
MTPTIVLILGHVLWDRSRGAVSKEWIVTRDAMRKGDSAGYTKLATMLHKNGSVRADKDGCPAAAAAAAAAAASFE